MADEETVKSKEHLCIRVLCILVLVFPALGTVLIETKQELPQKCLLWMEKNQECPARDEPLQKEKWEELNKLCCGAYDGTVMHCQTGEFRNRTQYNILACLKDRPIPPGYTGVVNKNENGYPDIKNELCEDGYFRSGYINSSFLPFAYCTADKSNCDILPGQEKACLEGPDKDDPCTCRPGFKAEPNSTSCSSVRGFLVKGCCSCQALGPEYEASQPPTSNPLPYCKDLPADQMKNWYRRNLQHSSPAVGNSTPVSSITIASSSKYPQGNITNNGADVTNRNLTTVTIVLSCIVFVMLIIVICCAIHLKQRRTYTVSDDARNLKNTKSAKPLINTTAA